MRAGIVVVGGGAMAAWAACELTRRANALHAPVVLLAPGSFEACAPAVTPILRGQLEDGPLRPAFVDGERIIEQFELMTGRGIGFGRPGLLRLDGTASSKEELRAPAHALGFVSEQSLQAEWLPTASFTDPWRMHAEVLNLGRTRGLVTRPGVVAKSLVRNNGKLIGLETTRGRIESDTVLITDLNAAKSLLPEARFALEASERVELRFTSPLLDHSQVSFGPPRGRVQELFEMGANLSALDAFFGSGEPLEYPHPAVSTSQIEVFPDVLAGEIVVVARHAFNVNGNAMHRVLSDLAPVFRNLGETPSKRRVQLTFALDRLPIIGEVQDGVFVALGLGLREAQLAAGLSPGVAALIYGEPVAAFDPGITRYGR